MAGIISPGLYFDMEAETYFADPAPTPSLSQSVAKVLIEQSPLHAKQQHPRLATVNETDDEPETEKYDAAKAIGNAAHGMILKRGKRIAVIDHKNFTTKAAKEAKASAIAEGAEPVLRKHNDIAHMLTLALKLQLNNIEGCERAFKPAHGNAEVVAFSNEDGLWLRTMMDFVTKDLREIWDLKTSGQSASPYLTGKLMASAGWHVQCAMHERILDAIDPNGAGRRRFFYVCQENDSPFALTVNEIGESALTIGRKQIEYAISAWRRCVDSDAWPAYPLRIIRPELPAWAENAWINREIKEFDEAQIPRVASPKITSLAGG